MQKENTVSSYSIRQEFKHLLWATPMPVMAMINSQACRLVVKGACPVAFVDKQKIRDKAP